MRGTTLILSVFFKIGGMIGGMLPSAIFALTTSETGLSTTANTAGLNVADTLNVETFVGAVINAALGIIGVVFLVLIVYGGILWMLSEGDETKVGKARGLIFHSIIGLILVLSAYAITNFVVGALIPKTIQP